MDPTLPPAPTPPPPAAALPRSAELPAALPDLEAAAAERQARLVLAERLEIFNLILCAFFAVLLGVSVYRLVANPFPDYNPVGSALANGAALTLAGAVVLALRRAPEVGRDGLRLAHWATFAMLAGYCLWFTLDKLYDNADGVLTRFIREHPVFAACAFSFAWFGLLLSYGTFVPNDWKRLAVQAAVFAVGPVVACAAVAAIDPAYRAAFSGVFYLALATILACGGAGVVYGCYSLTRLRQSVVEARRVGPYRLLGKVGEGGMGVVYKAEHHLVKRPCAIKFIHRHALADPAQRARFLREFQALARLSHWNLVEVYDYGETPDGACYYVMEYLDGVSLEQLVRRHGPLPPGRALYLLRQAADALRMAHRLGLVHRDVKPSNLFLTQGGGSFDVVKVLDFGLVHDAGHALGGQTLTSPGVVVGTPGYMPPEQTTGSGRIDPRTDVYALGAVAYFLLAGRAPYVGRSVAEIFAAQVSRDPDPLPTLRPDLPADVVAVVARCLARDPDDRFATVDDLLAAIDACACVADWNAQKAEQWHAAQAGDAPTAEAGRTLPGTVQQTLPTRPG